MVRRCGMMLVLVGVLLLTSCQRAQRMKPRPAAADIPDVKIETPDRGLYRVAWLDRPEPPDMPIVFVPDTSDEWPKLKSYWNALPFPGGMPTIHLGLPPLQAAAALAATEYAAIKIKVPLGLPDPTEYIPKSNPPTWGKWRLGAKLFHDRSLPAGSDYYSCATCHVPEKGFADSPETHPVEGKYNTLSLVNVVYNRRQFWDGRVESLEETLVRGMNDERPVDLAQSRDRALTHHNFGGFVRKLVESHRYHEDFKHIFGIEHPTQDAVGKALATYMRTILSGNSLFDRAEQVRKDLKAKTLTEAHFLALLEKKDKDGKNIPVVLHPETDKGLTRDDLSAIARGHGLFHGKKARCAVCHHGPLFTDGDFHNVGGEDQENWPIAGQETGRSLHVPVGQKQMRLLGAFRTPSLRNLVATGPYFHDGSLYTLPLVVDFFDSGIKGHAPYLAQQLKDGAEGQKLKLTDPEKADLVLFLRALEGTPVDAFVRAPHE